MMMMDKIIREVQGVFERYRFHRDISNALWNLGFRYWMGRGGEEIWLYHEKPQGCLLLYIDWDFAKVSIYERVKEK